MKRINGFDMDGVLTVGIRPSNEDVIITGRSYEEFEETKKWLIKNNIYNSIYMNIKVFDDKTRESSGFHKAMVIWYLDFHGKRIVNFFEDDEIQKAQIEKYCPWVNVIHVVHNLTEKENVRHLED